MPEDSTIKLQAYISHSGFASRRKAEAFIDQGLVTVNGVKAIIGQRVNPDTDVVAIEGKTLSLESTLRYFLVNKPIGYVSTASDDLGRPEILELLPKIKERIYPVGRLDIDSQGLLIVTNDGDLTYKLTHPRFEVGKTYEVALDRRPTLDALNHLRNSVRLKEGYTSPAEVKTLGRLDENFWVEITIHEGWNRQVRRMFERVGYEVLELVRTSMGPFNLDMLEDKRYLELTKEQVAELTDIIHRHPKQSDV